MGARTKHIKQVFESLGEALLQPVNKAGIILLGIYTVIWGFWVGSPWWTVFTQAKLYYLLAQVAPEMFWGCLAFSCGLVTIWGAVRRTYPALLIGSAVAGWHWFMIAIFYLLGDWQNTGGITALLLCVYAIFIYLNVKVNHHQKNRPMNEIVQ